MSMLFMLFVSVICFKSSRHGSGAASHVGRPTGGCQALSTSHTAARPPKAASAACMAPGPKWGLATPTLSKNPGPSSKAIQRNVWVDPARASGWGENGAMPCRLQCKAQASEGSPIASRPCTAVLPSSIKAPCSACGRVNDDIIMQEHIIGQHFITAQNLPTLDDPSHIQLSNTSCTRAAA
jgi:hypothetical protein